MFNFKKFAKFIPAKNNTRFWTILIVLWTINVITVWGWVNNIIWVCDQDLLVINGELIVSIIGILIFPIGMVHGIWLWF